MIEKNRELLKLFIFTFILLFSFQVLPCFSQGLQEEITDKYPAATPPIEKEVAEYYAPAEEPLGVSVTADVQQGYDNNVDLDPSRKKDGFIQSVCYAEVTIRPQVETLELRAGADLFGMVYYKYNSSNIFDIAPYAGIEWEFMPGFKWYNYITFDYLSFPNDKDSTYAGLEFNTYVRQFLTEDLFHQFGYEYIRRWYPDRKMSLGDASESVDNREDDRHKFKYTAGMYFSNFMVKIGNELYHNNSNDQYQDYYDYWVYRLKPSVMYFFTDNIYANASLIFKYIPYDARLSTEDPDKEVRDYTYIGNLSLYYDITESITFGVTYSYTENTSNDPYQKYSGSIFSGGVYYTF
ncbi:MAG: hypothetical protein WBB86_04515 [Candidatus Omnitrophota bacterium]